MLLLGIGVVETIFCLLEVPCMSIEVMDLEEIEFGSASLMQEIWTYESSVLLES